MDKLEMKKVLEFMKLIAITVIQNILDRLNDQLAPGSKKIWHILDMTVLKTRVFIYRIHDTSNQDWKNSFVKSGTWRTYIHKNRKPIY